MIGKKRKISRASFPHPQQKKIIFHGVYLTIVFYPQNTALQSSFCAIAPKKIFKTSVARNRFKRLVYEAVKRNQAQFDKQYRGSIVVSPKKTALHTIFPALLADVKGFLK